MKAVRKLTPFFQDDFCSRTAISRDSQITRLLSGPQRLLLGPYMWDFQPRKRVQNSAPPLCISKAAACQLLMLPSLGNQTVHRVHFSRAEIYPDSPVWPKKPPQTTAEITKPWILAIPLITRKIPNPLIYRLPQKGAEWIGSILKPGLENCTCLFVSL